MPLTEQANWTVTGLNNFRQNVQPEGEFAAPDLIVDLRAAWEGRRATLFGYARNAFNRFALTYLFTPTFGAAEDGREAGVGLEARF